MSQALQQNAKEMRARVYQHMLQTRGWKYKAFLRYLRLFKYAAFAPVRGAFLESYYTLMRYLDDIVDGDAPLPNGFENAHDYLQEKIRFSLHPENPIDEADYLMLYCFQLADRFGEDFSAETKDILESLLFDAGRRGKLLIYPEKVLMHHFHLLDIRGTIRATLKVFKEDPDKYTILEPLGIACRYQFDLEDFHTDIAAGYVNISEEDCERFDITKKDMLQTNSPNVQNWLRQRALDGFDLLKKHHQILPSGKFSLLSRATFPLVYEFPARSRFRKVLAEYPHFQKTNQDV